MIFVTNMKDIFIFVIIFAQLFATFAPANSEKWCTDYVPVRKTRTAWRHGSQMVTRRNWLGFVKTEWRPHTYTEVENYYDFERQTKCCIGYLPYFGDCTPICSPECPNNSYCDEPHICKCQSGYEQITNIGNTIVCSPICASGCPFYSACTTPDKCTCISGYNASNKNTCEPICADGCPDNSTCTSPDKCSCNVGYATKVDGTCEPICVSNCPSNSWCDAPNHCSCNSGYLMSSAQTCQPNCELGCPAYSSCFAPDHCECEPGYLMNENATLCEPQCKNGCPGHSVCLRPERCQCDEGYRMQTHLTSRPYCEPICEKDCSAYGKCVRPGVCECLPGYEMSAELAEKTPLCQPRCTKGCVHGFCFAPEICVCDPGYLMGPNNTCEPTCSLGCVHGKCVEPEICACAEGYRFQVGSVHICEPICEPACERADCVAPGICICWNRHQPAANSSSICVPTCPSECLHGHCNASFECSCDVGYVPHSYLSNECVPRCENCQNGDCFVPDDCNCWPGYSFYRGETEQCVWNSVSTAEADYYSEVTTDYTVMEDGSGVSISLGEDTTSDAGDVDLTESNSDEVSTIDIDNEATTTYRHADLAATITTSAVYDTAVSQVDFITELVASSRCESQCECWIEVDEFGAINTAHCLKICDDDYDQSCLNLSNCLCDLHRLQMICNNTDDSYEETAGLFYKCPKPIRMTAGVTDFPDIYVLGSNQRSTEMEEHSNVIWWIVGGLLCGFLVAATLAMLGWRFLKNNQEIADYDVVYQDGKAFVRA